MNIVTALFIALALGILTGGAVLLRWRDRFPALPQWTWRNIIALFALFATIGGAAVLTAAAWWLLDQLLIMARALIAELMKDPHARPEVGTVLTTIVDAVAWGLKLLLGGVIVVLLSLGIAITPRKIKVDKSGAELSGGDGEDPTPIPVTVTNAPSDPVPTTTDTGPSMPEGEHP